MPRVIGIKEAQGLLHEGAQLVDVLPEGEYTHKHLPAALSIPLKKMTDEAVGVLDRQRPLIVYCYDFQ